MSESAVKDAAHLYEVERRVRHVERPGFRIQELQIGPKQKVPWHYHSNVRDTFYVLQGQIRVFLRDPKEEVRLGPGESYAVLGPGQKLAHLFGRVDRGRGRVWRGRVGHGVFSRGHGRAGGSRG